MLHIIWVYSPFIQTLKQNCVLFDSTLSYSETTEFWFDNIHFWLVLDAVVPHPAWIHNLDIFHYS